MFPRLCLTLPLVLALGPIAQAQDWPDRTTLPIPLAPFEGEIGETYQDSTSDWQEPVAPPEGAPNIIVILLDDVGFGQTSTFGGLIPTPELDALAEEGLRFTRFHTTAICGPTRAALLTGRNHHSSGNGFLMEWATGFPSYSTLLPRETATIGEILKGNGYTTWWYGKNHNTPDWEQTVAGPFDRWPTGMGFDYFYGFNSGETHQFYPVIFENTVPVEPATTPEEGYHFMTDITDRAIARMKLSKSVAPDKPFFMYFAPGAMHAPHHVTAEWRDRFDGAFDMGWDAYREEVFARQKEMGIIPENTVLTPRPDWVEPWDSLSDDQKEVYTALFENFAGFFAFTDHEIGRLIDGGRGASRRREHHGHLHRRRQRRLRRGRPGRHAQRDHEPQRHPLEPRGHHGQSRQARRAGFRAALPGRLGLGRQHAVPVGQAGRLASGRHPQPDGRHLARPHRPRPGPA